MPDGSVAKNRQSRESRRAEAFEEWVAFKEQVKDAYRIDTAIEDFTGQRLQGRPGQGDRMGLCPFHNDSNPSMNVRPQEGYFKCHTAGCNAGGDVFKFISEYQGVSFKQAVLLAAERVGIEPPGDSSSYRRTERTGPARPRAPREKEMNPAKLFESDLLPAFKGIRPPKVNQFFKIWHPGGGRTITPCVKTYKPEMIHVYRDMRKMPIMAILRCLHKDGGKYFMPARVGKLPAEAPNVVVDDKVNRMGWLVKGTTNGHRKPIYGMEEALPWIARGGNHIQIVEGEKTCDAARRLIGQTDRAGDMLILSPMGGHNASLYADWTDFMATIDQEVLDRLTFSVWPDADHIKERPDGTKIDAQQLYVRDTIGAFATAARKAGLDPTKVTFERIYPGTSRENGWDLADAEQEGWTGEKVQREIDKGAKMPIENRFMELDVELTDEADPTPFEDGPEENDDLALSDLDEEDAELAELYATESEDPDYSQIPDAEIVEDENERTYAAVTEQLLGDGQAPTGEVVFERNLEAGDVVEAGLDGEIEIGEETGDGEIFTPGEAARRNPHFRCLGYRDQVNYFMSLRSGQIFGINYAAMRKQALLSLAPKEFWASYFTEFDKNGRGTIDWDEAVSELVQATYDAGFWDPKKEAGQGARVDGGRIVFNTGDRLWIQTQEDGRGVVDIAANFRGDYQYTVGEACGLPAFDNAFTAQDEEPWALLDLIKRIDWRAETSNLSVMAFFGWLCIGPICGVLPWRPHLWLDGQRAAGKSWIIENIIFPCLGSYAIRVKSNSTESGLRNILHSRAFPLVFDEAEGEMDGDSNRMASVLKLARHSATPGDSIVAQGVPGGNGQKFYSVASTFLLASITPQLEASADKTRFARAKLGPGHGFAKFTRELEKPAADLLTPEFSARMIARMVMRAGAMPQTQRMMVEALTQIGLERRLSDVWGTYAAGAWLLLKDGVPEDYHEAMEFIGENFGIEHEIREFADEIQEDKDHDRLFRAIMAYEVRVETLHLGARNFSIGAIIEMAVRPNEEDDEALDMKQATKKLADQGIRLAHKGAVAKEGQPVDGLLIHKYSPRILEMLRHTPYRNGYVDVIQQAGDVKNGPSVRFGGLGTYRSVVVPMKHFPLADEEEEYGDEGTHGRR